MALARSEVKLGSAARIKAWESLSDDESRKEFKVQAVRMYSGVSLETIMTELKAHTQRDSAQFKNKVQILDLYLFSCYEDLLSELSNLQKQSTHLSSSLSEEIDLIKNTINAARQVKNDMGVKHAEKEFSQIAKQFTSLKLEIESACSNYAEIKKETQDEFRRLRVTKQWLIEMNDAKTSPQENANVLLAELIKLNQKQNEVEQEIKNVNNHTVDSLMNAIRGIEVARVQLKELINETKAIEKSNLKLAVLEEQTKQNIARCKKERQVLHTILKKDCMSIMNLAAGKVEKETKYPDLTSKAALDAFAEMLRKTEKDMVSYQRGKDFLAKHLSQLNSERDDEWYEKQISGELLNSINKKKDSYKGIGHKPAKLGPSQDLKDGASVLAMVTAGCLGVAAAVSNPIGWGIFGAFVLTTSYFLIRNYLRSRERTRLLQKHEPGVAGLLQEENEKEKEEKRSTCSRDLRMLFMQEAIVRCDALTDEQYHNLKIHGECKAIHLERGEVPCVVNLKEGGKTFEKCRLFYNENNHALFFKNENGSLGEKLADNHEKRVEQFEKFSPPPAA